MNEIKSEYFELLKLLNKSNKSKNEITHLTFLIDDTDKKHLKLFGVLSKDQKILLCEKKSHEKWFPSGITKFNNLEDSIAKSVHKYYSGDFTNFVLSQIFELPD